MELFGVTTNGEFIDEVTEKGSVAMLLLDINKDYFQIFFEEYPNKNYRGVAKVVASKAKATFVKPAFILGMSHPALDITTKYGGLENVQPENEGLLIEIAANFPLQLQREKGDPVMRPPLVVDWTDMSISAVSVGYCHSAL